MTNAILLAAATVREKAGLSLRQISRDTKISTRNLEAIENGDFGRLPGGVYATSYIRQYARSIGFDEFDLLALYHRVTGAPPDTAAIGEGAEPKPAWLSSSLPTLIE